MGKEAIKDAVVLLVTLLIYFWLVDPLRKYLPTVVK